MSNSEKSAFFRHFLLITYFWYIFSKLFQRIRNQREILHFLTPFFRIFQKFFELWLQMRRKWLKKTENLFLWMYPRIWLCNHQRVCITKLLKSLYPNFHCICSTSVGTALSVGRVFSIPSPRAKSISFTDEGRTTKKWKHSIAETSASEPSTTGMPTTGRMPASEPSTADSQQQKRLQYQNHQQQGCQQQEGRQHQNHQQ